MKIAKLILGIVFSAVLFASCENGDNNTLPPNPVEGECYVGTLKVDQNDGTFYTQEDVEVDYQIIDGKLNFVIFQCFLRIFYIPCQEFLIGSVPPRELRLGFCFFRQIKYLTYNRTATTQAAYDFIIIANNLIPPRSVFTG